jgi:hypothetical protein
MIYKVTIITPAINEEVVLAADSEEEAKELAVASAASRAAKDATVTVEELPDELQAKE